MPGCISQFALQPYAYAPKASITLTRITFTRIHDRRDDGQIPVQIWCCTSVLSAAERCVLPVQGLRLHRPCPERRQAFSISGPWREMWKWLLMHVWCLLVRCSLSVAVEDVESSWEY